MLFTFGEEESWELFGRVLDCNVHDNFKRAWREAKFPIVELFGGKTRIEKDIVCEVTDQNVIRTMDKLYERYCAKEPSLALDSVYFELIGGSLFPILDIPDNKLSFAVSDPRPEKAGKFLPAGTKITKYIDLLAMARGLCKRDRKVLQDVLSDTIAMCREQQLVLVVSVNPLDILLASECTAGGWKSCHSIRGEYCTGPLSYALDSVTAIAYTYCKDNLAEPWIKGVKLPKKTWRQMIYFDLNNKSALCSREYPGERPAMAKEARQLVAQILNRGEPVKWKYKDLTKTISDEDPEYRTFSFFLGKQGYYHYRDDPNAWVRLADGNPPKIYAGVESLVCPNCGSTRDDGRHDLLLCMGCSDVVVCTNCDELVYLDGEVHEVDGDYYCDSCYHDIFTACDYCDEVVVREDAYNVAGVYFCGHCFKKYCATCCYCGDTMLLEDSFEDHEGNIYCGYCFDNHTWACEQCGEVFSESHQRFKAFAPELARHLSVCSECCATCDGCGETFVAGALSDGLCPDCIEMEVSGECAQILA